MIVQIHTVYTDRHKTHIKVWGDLFLLTLIVNKIQYASIQKDCKYKGWNHISDLGNHCSSGHTVGFQKVFSILPLSKDAYC